MSKMIITVLAFLLLSDITFAESKPEDRGTRKPAQVADSIAKTTAKGSFFCDYVGPNVGDNTMAPNRYPSSGLMPTLSAKLQEYCDLSLPFSTGNQKVGDSYFSVENYYCCTHK
jgi:hypothetical protein